jgi:hypothetical protein
MTQEYPMNNAPPPEPAPTPPWANWPNPKTVAGRLGMSERTIRRMLARGILSGRNVGAGTVPRYVIDPASVDAIARPVSPPSLNSN